MATTNEEYTKAFKAFCDEKRLRILELLRNGEKCACELMEELDMPQSSLSYHMKILYEAGIVDSRPDGKWLYYKISNKGIDKAVMILKALTMPNVVVEESSCSKK